MNESDIFEATVASGATFEEEPLHGGGRTYPGSTRRQPIRLLPTDVSARIAAGEVIERPASVVKELVENALDAGARSVRIDVHGGGLRLIRVGDDGAGIPPGELWLACQRHATSKLAGSSLSRVSTLGFRGEALPSIAAVADLTVVTADDDSGLGRRLTMRDGRAVADEPAPRPRGTTVTVSNLFHRLPARLASAGRAQTEISQIGQTARRLALAAPRVRSSLVVDGRQIFQTTGSGDPFSALVEVYGPGLSGTLVPLGPINTPVASISGVVAGSEVTRPGRGQVNVVVNGRWVQPRGLLSHLETAYRPLLPRGRHPVLLLVIEVEPDEVDINVHPSKLEVRLLRERDIGAAAGELIRQTLGRRASPLRLSPAMGIDALPRLSGVAETRAGYGADGADDADDPIVTPNLPPLRLVGQVNNRLMMLEGDAGLFLVDQHRAHERVLFERFATTHGGGEPEPVALPEPVLLELRAPQVTRFAQRLDDLAALGFECEVFGGRAFLLRAAPVLPGSLATLSDPDDVTAAVLALADEEAGEGEDWRQRLLVGLACRTAVRRGRSLDRSSMRALVEALGQTPAPAVCPHGSPLLMHLSGDLFERQFDWR
ncbi:MAG: DNA mismatch repair endonuclease MutL [Thermomicrobiales bacterium]